MIDAIKQLREETGAPIGEIRAALTESGGDAGRARAILSEKLGALAGKKSGRALRAGVVDAYVHSNARVGALLELQCETDFVARNPEFRRLAHELAMQIAATAPQDSDALLQEEYIRDPSRRIGDVIKGAIGTFGENIKIGGFARFEL